MASDDRHDKIILALLYPPADGGATQWLTQWHHFRSAIFEVSESKVVTKPNKLIEFGPASAAYTR